MNYRKIKIILSLPLIIILLSGNVCDIPDPDNTTPPSDRRRVFEFDYIQQYDDVNLELLDAFPLGWENAQDEIYTDTTVGFDRYVVGDQQLSLERLPYDVDMMLAYAGENCHKDNFNGPYYFRHHVAVQGFKDPNPDVDTILTSFGGGTVRPPISVTPDGEQQWASFVRVSDAWSIYGDEGAEVDDIEQVITKGSIHELMHLLVPTINDCEVASGEHIMPCVMTGIDWERLLDNSLVLWAQCGVGYRTNHTLTPCSECINRLLNYRSNWPEELNN